MSPEFDSATAGAQADSILDALVEEIAAKLQAGEPVDLEAYARGDVSLVSQLRHLLPAIEVMATLGRSPVLDETPPVSTRSGPFASRDLVGNFRIIREVGRGGMGIVYEAEQVPLGRRVALKVLPLAAAMDPRQLARFRVEAQAAAHLRHPNILPIYALDVDRGVHFHVMPFIEGPSPAQLICDHKPPLKVEGMHGLADPDPERITGGRISPRETARLGVQAADAIAYAHEQGVMHRDIKPANLLLDGHGHLWVADFGLARFRDDVGLTATGDMLGTLRYLSPEQAAGRKVLDPRSDIYALGATLYELLTLRPAFEGDDRQDLLRRIVVEEPPSPHRLDPTIPRDLETIVLKAMAKEPDGRYASADELADDLRRFLEGRPILARRPGPLEQASRWMRRHQAMSATAAGVLILAVTLLSVGSALLWREQRRTRGNLDLALQALDDFGRVTGEVGFGRDPERTQEQRGLQLNSVQLYERLIRQNPADLGPRWGPARAYECLGNLQIELDRFREAETAYRAADALLKGLVDDARGDSRYQESSSRVLDRLGTVLKRTGRAREAEGLFRRALAIDRQLVAEFPGVAAHRMSLSRSCINLGLVLGFKVHPDEVGRLFGEALELRRGLADDSATSRAALAEAYGYVGHLAFGTGRSRAASESMDRAIAIAEALQEDAGADPVRRLAVATLFSTICCPPLCHPSDPQALARYYRRALSSWEGLATGFPTIPDFRARLASAYEAFVPTLAVAGLDSEFIPARRRSAEIWEDLVGHYPAVIRYRERLAQAMLALGEALLERGNPQDATPQINRAAELAADNVPMLNRVAWLWATSPEACGLDPSRAVALAERLVAQKPERWGYWMTLGVARPRAGDWAGTKAALACSISLRGSGDPTVLLLLAKAHWHLGDVTAARQHYDRAALALREQSAGPDPHVDSLRAEIAALLSRPTPHRIIRLAR
jgi:eukaryotic-like serine/threonine-protein kinase